MVSNGELNQEKLNQITILSALLECEFEGDISEVEGSEEYMMNGFYIYQKGWNQSDAEKIQQKILELMDELK